MSNIVYERPYRVNTYEADASGKISIPGLFNFLQDVAARHATILHRGRDDLDKDNRFWVLSRILVRMNRNPVWEEEFIIRTWPNGVDSLFALRDFEIVGSTGEKYGAATSCWLMVNKENRRPVRPDKSLASLGLVNNIYSSLDRYPHKLPGASESSYESGIYPVRYSDLDINMHVNNVQYIRWTIDTYPLGFILNSKMLSAEVNYVAEALPGDEITVRTSETEKNIFDHSIFRPSDGKELCRLRISWEA